MDRCIVDQYNGPVHVISYVVLPMLKINRFSLSNGFFDLMVGGPLQEMTSSHIRHYYTGHVGIRTTILLNIVATEVLKCLP